MTDSTPINAEDDAEEVEDTGGWLDDPNLAVEETFEEQVYRAALRYALAGYRVHPLRPGTKVPIIPDWPNAATTDPEVIAKWFGPTGAYRGGNLGIATGRESNLWVLDVDLGDSKPQAEQAKQSFARLVIENGAFEGHKVITPSGSWHFWFQWPDEVPDPTTGELPTWRNIASTVLGDGIDVRGEGGQVAVWPSQTNEGFYTEGHGPIPRVPAWLAEKTRHRPKVGSGLVVRKVDLPDHVQGRAEAYALSAINGVLGDLDEMRAAIDPHYRPDAQSGYQGRPWNDTCFKVAMRLLDFVAADWSGLSEGDAYSLFFEHAPRDQWFTNDTVQTIWSSAFKSHDGTPATLPESIRNPSTQNFFGTGPGNNPSVTAGTQANPDGSPKPNIALPLLGGPRGDKVLLENVAKIISQDTIGFGHDRLPWVYEAGVWSPDPDVVSKRAARLLHNDFGAGQVPTITAHLKADPDVPQIGDGLHENLINTRSGMLDWRTGTLQPHSPDFKSTIQLPVEWQPDATCPRFDRWLSQVASEEIQQRIWDVIGYMVLSGNPLQRAILLYGSGGNGKGTLIRVLTALLGKWNISAVTLKSMEKGTFEVANLYGKQANLAGDIDASHMKDTAMFKSLTGQDVVNAQHKHQKPFDFLCHATPLFSANELWRSSDNSEGYHRRWVVVPMNVKVADLGERLDERELLAELPGILAHAVRSLRGLMARGEFSEGVETQMATADFQEASDLVRIWLAEDDAIKRKEEGCLDAGTRISRTALYNRFKVWARDNGFGQLSAKKFRERLIAFGYTYKEVAAGRFFYGFDLASNPEGFMEHLPVGSWQQDFRP